MAAPGTPKQTSAGREESAMLIPPNAAPPAYSAEKQPGHAPAQQQGGQLPEGQYYPQVQLGGVLPQTWQQGYPMPQVHAGQMPTMIVAPPSDHPAPHDFIILALVTTIICGILNLISLSFGIPALIFAVMSLNARNNKDYPQAKRYGRNALILTVLNIMFSLCLALLIIGLTVGFICVDPASYSYNYYYGFYGSC